MWARRSLSRPVSSRGSSRYAYPGPGVVARRRRTSRSMLIVVVLPTADHAFPPLVDLAGGHRRQWLARPHFMGTSSEGSPAPCSPSMLQWTSSSFALKWQSSRERTPIDHGEPGPARTITLHRIVCMADPADALPIMVARSHSNRGNSSRLELASGSRYSLFNPWTDFSRLQE